MYHINPSRDYADVRQRIQGIHARLVTKGAQHGRRKMKVTRSEERVFIPKQTHFTVKNDMKQHQLH
jgi:hypothetical protein